RSSRRCGAGRCPSASHFKQPGSPSSCGAKWPGCGDRRPIGRTTGMSDPAVTLLRAELRQRWQRGERGPVEAYLERLPDPRGNAEAVLDLVYQEILLRQEAGEAPRLEAYLARFPQLAEQLRLLFQVHEGLAESAATNAATL